jgi:hypothetical protein
MQVEHEIQAFMHLTPEISLLYDNLAQGKDVKPIPEAPWFQPKKYLRKLQNVCPFYMKYRTTNVRTVLLPQSPIF